MEKIRVAVTAASDPGLKRSNNEDSHGFWIPEDAIERARRGVLLVISDGMGGSRAGEVASRLAVDTVIRTFRDAEGDQPREELQAAVEAANRAVYDHSRSDPALRGMGATCTAAVIRGGEAWLAHVGDSRAYLIRGRGIQQLTQDHSLVAQLVQRHQLTHDEARHDERRNVVTRSVGIAETVEVDVEKLDVELEPGDALLLCSDGLHGQVSDAELAKVVSTRGQDAVPRALIAIANERGGPDNITAMIARLEVVDVPAAASARVQGAVDRGADQEPQSRTRTMLWLILALMTLAATVALGFWLIRQLNRETPRLEQAGPR